MGGGKRETKRWRKERKGGRGEGGEQEKEQGRVKRKRELRGERERSV